MTDTPYSKLVVNGADALEFLQGQLTIDLQKLGVGDSQRAGWCNPKGRVICLFDVSATDEGFSLRLPACRVGRRRTKASDDVSVSIQSRFRVADQR